MSIHEGHRQRLKQRFADHGERVLTITSFWS